MSLDRDGDGLRRLLHHAADAMVELYESMSARPVFLGIARLPAACNAGKRWVEGHRLHELHLERQPARRW